MLILKYAVLVVLALSGFVLLYFYLRSGKPLKWMFFNVFSGLFVFLLLVLTKPYTNVCLSLNEWTAAVVSVLGLPGICGLLLLPIIF